jgi:hypothetical protein
LEFEFTWIESSLVVCRASGVASADGFAALLKALASQPEFGPGVKVLADRSKLAVSELSAGDVERIADIRAKSADGMGMRTALVVGSSSAASRPPATSSDGQTQRARAGRGREEVVRQRPRARADR